MKKKPTVVIASVIAAAALGLVLWLVVFARGSDDDLLEASGAVEASEARLGFPTAGRVESIAVHEGDRVAQGAELAILDRTEMLARLDQVKAQARAARAQLNELERGFRSEEIAQARSALSVARERLNDAERDLERTRKLHEGGALSREAYDKAVMALQVARGENARAEEQLSLMESGPRREQIEARQAQLDQAQAAVRVIEATLAGMIITAPFDGVVTVRHRVAGEVVAPGSAVVTIMNPDDRWVRIYVREDRIGAVHLGQPATIKNDTYADKEYSGQVVFIASQAEFTPKNVQTAEERVKLVYAVKVRIADDATHDLKPGMPADIRIGLEGAQR